MKQLCKIEGCNKNHLARGWCCMHYTRWYRNGNPLTAKFEIHNGPVTWEYLLSCSITDEETGCIEWQKAKSEGYGSICTNGISDRTHRISYKLHYGNIKKGLYVLHKCDNELCINPRHLFLGTQKDNMSDASNKGRISRGEKHYSAKLTEKDVLFIRKMSDTNKQAAKIFRVTASTISSIRCGITWRWLI